MVYVCKAFPNAAYKGCQGWLDHFAVRNVGGQGIPLVNACGVLRRRRQLQRQLLL